MTRRIRLTSAALIVAVASVVVGLVAYDKGRADPPSQAATYVGLGVASKPVVAQVLASRATIVSLSKRSGCILQDRSAPKAFCDAGVAFPDVGLVGTVAFVTRRSDISTETLAVNLGK